MSNIICVDDLVSSWSIEASEQTVVGYHAPFGPRSLVVLQDVVHNVSLVQNVVVLGRNDLSLLNVGERLLIHR